MSSRKQYIPILVLYIRDLGHMDMDMKTQLLRQVEELKKELGYHILLFPSTENRAEIISATKATKVEDLQKYIDEKFMKLTDEIKIES